VRLLKRIAEWLGKDFDKVEGGDIRRVIAQIGKSKLQEWTKQNYKVAIKRFYHWFYKLPKGKDPEITEWIRTMVKNNGKKLPEDLLSEDEVKRMIDATPHTRDKALDYAGLRAILRSARSRHNRRAETLGLLKLTRDF
jgi:site-specific recombinase XerD